MSAPAASTGNSSRPARGATITARGISPPAWCAPHTAAASATACTCWPRAVAAAPPAAAGRTARQAPAACAAQSTDTRGTTARTGRIRAVIGTRPACSRFPVTAPAPGRLAGTSSPPARPPKPTCTARHASEPSTRHAKHHPSRISGAPWPTPTLTVAARLSSSSGHAASTRPRFGPRDANVHTSLAPAARRRFRRSVAPGAAALHSPQDGGSRRPGQPTRPRGFAPRTGRTPWSPRVRRLRSHRRRWFLDSARRRPRCRRCETNLVRPCADIHGRFLSC